MTRKQLIAAMEREKKKIAASRDKLRELLDEYRQIDDDATDALDSLEYAVEALSRQV